MLLLGGFRTGITGAGETRQPPPASWHLPFQWKLKMTIACATTFGTSSPFPSFTHSIRPTTNPLQKQVPSADMISQICFQHPCVTLLDNRNRQSSVARCHRDPSYVFSCGSRNDTHDPSLLCPTSSTVQTTLVRDSELESRQTLTPEMPHAYVSRIF
ncbi:hypothetical protein ACLOJK_030569 [Asimina triloba]